MYVCTNTNAKISIMSKFEITINLYAHTFTNVNIHHLILKTLLMYLKNKYMNLRPYSIIQPCIHYFSNQFTYLLTQSVTQTCIY